MKQDGFIDQNSFDRKLWSTSKNQRPFMNILVDKLWFPTEQIWKDSAFFKNGNGTLFSRFFFKRTLFPMLNELYSSFWAIIRPFLIFENRNKWYIMIRFSLDVWIAVFMSESAFKRLLLIWKWQLWSGQVQNLSHGKIFEMVTINVEYWKFLCYDRIMWP